MSSSMSCGARAGPGELVTTAARHDGGSSRRRLVTTAARHDGSSRRRLVTTRTRCPAATTHASTRVMPAPQPLSSRHAHASVRSTPCVRNPARLAVSRLGRACRVRQGPHHAGVARVGVMEHAPIQRAAQRAAVRKLLQGCGAHDAPRTKNQLKLLFKPGAQPCSASSQVRAFGGRRRRQRRERVDPGQPFQRCASVCASGPCGLAGTRPRGFTATQRADLDDVEPPLLDLRQALGLWPACLAQSAVAAGGASATAAAQHRHGPARRPRTHHATAHEHTARAGLGSGCGAPAQSAGADGLLGVDGVGGDDVGVADALGERRLLWVRRAGVRWGSAGRRGKGRQEPAARGGSAVHGSWLASQARYPDLPTMIYSLHIYYTIFPIHILHIHNSVYIYNT
jgi:hypothetical protein